jgi:hypothetical protein
MSTKKDEDPKRQFQYIMSDWENYDWELTPEENLIELILYLDFVDDAVQVLDQFKRRKYK